MALYQYKLHTLSPLILSPRASYAYYRSLHFQNLDNANIPSELNSEKIQIIYPFYQYGTYQEYAPSNADYYIPGSSIKGAVKGTGAETCATSSLMVDDVPIKAEQIVLNNMYKLQHIPKADNSSGNMKQMKLEPFFPNVAIEMLQADTYHTVTLICNEDPGEILEKTHNHSRKLLKQMTDRIDQILDLKTCNRSEENDCPKLLDFLKVVQSKILSLPDNTNENIFLVLLGGYKGLLLSSILKEKDKGGLYIDKTSRLPYGVVTLKLERIQDE